MEADMVHSFIERERVEKNAYVFYYDALGLATIARMCGPRYNFNVIGMGPEDFKNFNKLCLAANSPFISQKKTQDNQNFLVSQVSHFKVVSDDPGPGVLYFKTDFDKDEFKSVDFNRKGRNAPVANLQALLNMPHPISQKKYEDLQKLLKWVPRRFHDFYKNLHHD